MEVRSLTFPLGPVLDAHGKPAVGHALACYNPGTDTLRSWYADPQLTVPAPNPDRVGADGRIAQKFLWDGVSEIRQYAPVSASSTIPDNLQDFPGTEWSLVASWLEDGLHPTSGETILTVDTVDDLRTLLNEKATEGLVAVRGYSAADDEIGVRFYQFVAGSTQNDDGGAVLNSGLGGRWFLKVQTSDVDVRWWGALPDTGVDCTAAISAAVAWAGSNGYTLWFPTGCYQVTGGSETLGAARFDEGVTFNATDSAYSLTLTSAWQIDGTGAFKDASSAQNVTVVFSASAAPGTCYQSWNGGTAGGSGFNGHDVVLTGYRLAITSATSVNAVRVDSNDAVLDVVSNGGTIETLVSGVGGTTVQGAASQKVSIGTAYASAFKSGQGANVADHCNIWTLILDADISFNGKDVSFGTIVAGGGKITAANSVTCTSVVVQSSTPWIGAALNGLVTSGTPLQVEMFETLDKLALKSVATNGGNGIADCHGKNVTISGAVPAGVDSIRDAAISGAVEVGYGASVSFERCTFDTSLQVNGGTAVLDGCNVTNFGFNSGMGTSVVVANSSTFSGTWAGGGYGGVSSVQMTDCQISATGVEFVYARTRLRGCAFDNQFSVERAVSLDIQDCRTNYAGAAFTFDKDVSYLDTSVLAEPIVVKNNTPCVLVPAYSTYPHWDQTEGDVQFPRFTTSTETAFNVLQLPSALGVWSLGGGVAANVVNDADPTDPIEFNGYTKHDATGLYVGIQVNSGNTARVGFAHFKFSIFKTTP